MLKIRDQIVETGSVTIRPGYWIALAIAVTLFACTAIAGAVLTTIDRHQRAHNDLALRGLTATRWPIQLHPWQSNGCGWTKVRLCFKNYETVEGAARRAAAAMGLKNATSRTYPGYDGAPVAEVSGTFDGVPATVTAFPRVEYSASGDGEATKLVDVEVNLRPWTILSPAEPT